MENKLVIFFTHGMGDITEKDFDKRVSKLSRSLCRKIEIGRSLIFFRPLFYQDILQNNQHLVYTETRNEAKIDWKKLRKFMLYSFSDATSLEHRAHRKDSVYFKTQHRIFDVITRAYKDLEGGTADVIFIAHSLGCQVISNYIWDSQAQHPTQGIWTENHNLSPEVEDFAKLKGLRVLITTGCNIPIFIAGQNNIQSINTNRDGYSFEWHNFYDRDDVLGWPLKPLGKFYNPKNGGASYYESVTHDHMINAFRSLSGVLVKSWNPLSHGQYWKNNKFIKFLRDKIIELLR